jgi:hypothetical protein
VCLACVSQTVVRRLKQWQTRDPALNPFIEVGEDGTVTGHSLPSTTPSSASPKPNILEDDLVIPGPSVAFGEPQPLGFRAALVNALGLTEPDLAELRDTDLAHTSPFVANTLCAVRDQLGCVVRGVCALHGVLVKGWRAGGRGEAR